MNTEQIVNVIGWSHLLQPPLSIWIARPQALNLGGALASLEGVTARIVRVMAGASIALPTAQGVLLAIYADTVRTNAAVGALALLISAFWSCRLLAQLWMWGTWPAQFRSYYWFLTAVYLLQGPLLASVVTRNMFHG